MLHNCSEQMHLTEQANPSNHILLQNKLQLYLTALCFEMKSFNNEW